MNSYLTEINLKPIHQWSYFWRSLSSQVSVLEYYFPFSPFFNKEDQSLCILTGKLVWNVANKIQVWIIKHKPALGFCLVSSSLNGNQLSYTG